ncbi:hypothetical protein GTQ99_16265 [Kineococcus sp. T13]|uniref:hypothetical protein n=1 Tax=Kineococcus vitellinus TaxID=2696565 RepID=UPI0014134DD1|nr:hypothetical protein [Kineococcus vitellinus]NAZ76964.1 hypothetical protein [Kineococcus vitellinus]
MTEHTPAPRLHADASERYCEELLLALRMQDVPGQRIGEVLGEVRDHLASSGEDPVEAFGAPRDYAAALTADPTADRSTGRRSARALEAARNAAGVAGLLWSVEGATALLTGRPAVVSEFQVLLPVAVAVAAPLLVDVVATARRAGALGWGLLVAAVLAAAATTRAWAGPLLEVPVPAAVLLVPGLLVAAAWIVATARAVDPVLDPLQGAASSRRRRRRASARLTALLLLLLVAPVVVSVGLQHLG